ncbi:HAD family hydrolase [Peptostreptococcus canis]|uniref:phosphoserine phosphatase n=1 Tax=Peptostreptococcus canis TaxID=1159213 RepID=A0ABR6TL49_9FIRM|nr:HAD-IB family hydrolase [Peptostreptococcus canis]MBC2576133.1 HAD-IB family hydrolase [Peptostreptococcus canis]MBP1998334.1 HAD superfamily hydrolase (TIGR01490 family) [Peptostreptococcus canis]
MLKNIAAFFDIDGTLYRDSLLIEHFKKLIKYEIIDSREWSEHLETTYKNWDKRQGNYDDYLYEISDQYVEAITGLNRSFMDFATKQVIKLKADRVYKYTRSKIKWHKEQGHIIIFISGSPDFLVDKMAEKYKVDDNIGSKYLVENGKMTGEVIPMWDSSSKNESINLFIEKYNIDMDKSFAYGDTNGDITMLKRVGNPIAFNPSRELLTHISQDEQLSKNIKVVIERKDVIYQVPANVLHIENCCNTY